MYWIELSTGDFVNLDQVQVVRFGVKEVWLYGQGSEEDGARYSFEEDMALIRKHLKQLANPRATQSATAERFDSLANRDP